MRRRGWQVLPKLAVVSMLFEQFAKFGFRRDHVGFSNVPVWFEIRQVVQDARRNLVRGTFGIFL